MKQFLLAPLASSATVALGLTLRSAGGPTGEGHAGGAAAALTQPHPNLIASAVIVSSGTNRELSGVMQVRKKEEDEDSTPVMKKVYVDKSNANWMSSKGIDPRVAGFDENDKLLAKDATVNKAFENFFNKNNKLEELLSSEQMTIDAARLASENTSLGVRIRHAETHIDGGWGIHRYELDLNPAGKCNPRCWPQELFSFFQLEFPSGEELENNKYFLSVVLRTGQSWIDASFFFLYKGNPYDSPPGKEPKNPLWIAGRAAGYPLHLPFAAAHTEFDDLADMRKREDFQELFGNGPFEVVLGENMREKVWFPPPADEKAPPPPARRLSGRTKPEGAF
ncbi:unnamed protein product [Amoebophrya sp. A25]|nr:unnamed protein product [Amoebophrya sp. A25]|eukprot:GSA25T00024972001.1